MQISGFGCDTAEVINILAHRNAMQRALIEQEYKTIYSEELTKRLESELRGDIEVQRGDYPYFFSIHKLSLARTYRIVFPTAYIL